MPAVENISYKEYLNKIGNDIELLPGVSEWFERINAYGKELV